MVCGQKITATISLFLARRHPRKRICSRATCSICSKSHVEIVKNPNKVPLAPQGLLDPPVPQDLKGHQGPRALQDLAVQAQLGRQVPLGLQELRDPLDLQDLVVRAQQERRGLLAPRDRQAQRGRRVLLAREAIPALPVLQDLLDLLGLLGLQGPRDLRDQKERPEPMVWRSMRFFTPQKRVSSRKEILLEQRHRVL